MSSSKYSKEQLKAMAKAIQKRPYPEYKYFCDVVAARTNTTYPYVSDKIAEYSRG